MPYWRGICHAPRRMPACTEARTHRGPRFGCCALRGASVTCQQVSVGVRRAGKQRACGGSCPAPLVTAERRASSALALLATKAHCRLWTRRSQLAMRKNCLSLSGGWCLWHPVCGFRGNILCRRSCPSARAGGPRRLSGAVEFSSLREHGAVGQLGFASRLSRRPAPGQTRASSAVVQGQ